MNQKTGVKIPCVTLNQKNEPCYQRPEGLGFAKPSFTDAPIAESGEFIDADFFQESNPDPAKDKEIW